MDSEAFRRHGHEVIEWVADYLRDVERYRVLPDVRPGEIRDRLPSAPPLQGEAFESILADFREIILPGVTHWNHPRFFAYFPANNSGPAILGELLSAALGVNAMVWQSCPAATELEEVAIDWLRQMIGLPAEFRGVIQDTASMSTLVALLCAREQATRFEANTRGLTGGSGGLGGPGGSGGALRVYASSESHSSVEKGVKAAGLGAANLVKIAVDRDYALDPRDLERRIAEDLAAGHRPCCVVATIGTTSSTAIDPLPEIVAIAKQHGLWVHVDAALAGSAAILPECRALLSGAEGADSLVFNPHKWLFTNFDCSAFFCRRPEHLIKTLSIDPEYLKTAFDTGATNFRDWGLPLGRRFRALKLWFVLRHYGVEGLQAKLREHLAWARAVKRLIEESEDFELLAPVPLNTVCFRYNPAQADGDRDGRTTGGRKLRARPRSRARSRERGAARADQRFGQDLHDPHAARGPLLPAPLHRADADPLDARRGGVELDPRVRRRVGGGAAARLSASFPAAISRGAGYAAEAQWTQGSSRRIRTVTGGIMDMLEQIFEKQRELNRYTFERNRLPEFDAIARDRRLQNEWVRNYALAMTQEVAELVDSTNWKWWRTQVDLFDEQNLKVELVDILHFWVSACQVMGLSADDVHRMYMQKNAINARRQETGYITKDDGDNRSIG